MLNYANLDPIDFENLCVDIMEQKLAIDLRTFGSGADDGIDLIDDLVKKNIVIQVKRYINSPFHSLYSSLKKELVKVKKINPNSYYICCSKQLTPQNILDIYTLFEDYMESDKNIITLKEIERFLKREENKEILKKHAKLWIEASGILEELLNNDIFIDCETLLSDIKEDYKFYVQTEIYNECLKMLTKERAIIILGDPGIGKTVTSKMLILYFAQEGYRVRYTTNGDISNLKKSISVDKDKKEIIFLDDFLGQCYFNLQEQQSSEILSLMKYVKSNDSKILVLNSRVTIFNEAKESSNDFAKYIDMDKIKIKIFDIDGKLSDLEKARILVAHMKHNKVPEEYIENIRVDKRYYNIIKHRNYCPRIIEFVTIKTRYSDINNKDYYSFIISRLDNPEDIWANEFERRLSNTDRILINTLYSLSDKAVDYNVLKECFIKRVVIEKNIDTSIDVFEKTLRRLNKSILKITINRTKKEISVYNPSVNDYLRSTFFNNTAELIKVRESITYIEQIYRCYDKKGNNNKFKDLFISKEILDMKSMNKRILPITILSKLSEFLVKDMYYRDYILMNIGKVSESIFLEGTVFYKSNIVIKLLTSNLYKYYNLKDVLVDEKLFKDFTTNLGLDELTSVVSIYYNKIKDLYDKKEISEIRFDQLLEAINEWMGNEVIEYLEDIELSDIISDIDVVGKVDLQDIYDKDGSVSISGDIVDDVVDEMENIIYDVLSEELNELDQNIDSPIDSIFIRDYINEYEVEEIVEKIFEDLYNYDIDDEEYRLSRSYETDNIKMEIDKLFNNY